MNKRKPQQPAKKVKVFIARFSIAECPYANLALTTPKPLGTGCRTFLTVSVTVFRIFKSGRSFIHADFLELFKSTYPAHLDRDARVFPYPPHGFGILRSVVYPLLRSINADFDALECYYGKVVSP
jgi:hypothetical protein